MKYKFFLSAAIIFLAITITGCKKGFLDLDPIDRYTYYNFPENESQIEQSVAGAYRKLHGIYNNDLWIWGDMLSDNTSFRFNVNDRGGVRIEEIDEFVGLSDNPNFGGLYQESFDGVQRSNYVLQNIDAIKFASDSVKNIRKAEARFLRAWHYFNLVRIYGDVPILTKVEVDPLIAGNPASTYPRKPVAEVYSTVIEPDVLFAIDSLPVTVPVAQKGRLTKAAGRVLLAKVYMTQKKFSVAVPVLQALTTAGFSLNPVYANNFNPATKNGVESIFEVQADPLLGYSFTFMTSWAPWGTGTTIWPGGSNSRGGLNQPTTSLNNAYETNDNRKAVTVGSSGTGVNTILFMRKFLYWDAVQRANTCNFPVYRYSDVLLMYAECLNEAGFPNAQAFTLLNQVRTRAGLPNKTEGNVLPALAVNDQAAFRLAIEQERRVEFAGECHRWFDLVRTDRAVTVMTAHGVQEKTIKTTLNSNAYANIRTLMAIPFRETSQFGYPQNPGW
jgi:starch-binding outer membrane protein, SusD/RagB family